MFSSLKKKLIAAIVSTAVLAMAIMPAFAADGDHPASLYGLYNGSYVYSEHASNAVKSCEEYSVTTGYITYKLELNTVTYTYGDDTYYGYVTELGGQTVNYDGNPATDSSAVGTVYIVVDTSKTITTANKNTAYEIDGFNLVVYNADDGSAFTHPTSFDTAGFRMN